MNTAKLITMALTFLVFALSAQAQDEADFDPRAAIKQIKKDLDTIVEDLAELSGSNLDSEKGERVVENIDKLLQGMQESQDRVVSSFDDLIQKMKSKKSKSSSSSSSKGKQQSNSKGSKSKGKSPKKGSRRDRNKERQSGKGKPESKGEEEKGSKPGEDGEPKDSQQGDGDLRNTKTGRKSPKSGREETPVQIDAKGWGHLPAEVRQLLIDKNFRDYFPDYEREISDYLKSLNRRKK